MENRSRAEQSLSGISKSAATKFVVLIGVASLFSDFTYEGARSITGPFLATLGASATVVGVVAGFGELIGYALRLVSGYLTDKTGRYWTIVLLGYALNLFAAPLLALAGRWDVAAVLIIAERMGKAVRTPARDVMLSHASDRIGRGWGFGLHEALDQIGAIIGPLSVAAILYFKGGYETSFALLLIPALICLAVIFSAMVLYPNPHDLGTAAVKLESTGFSRIFWLYVVGVALIASGYADFALAAYHFEKLSIVPDHWIPVFYAIAMGVDALAAIILGRLFDRIGLWAFILATMLSLLFAPLVFLGGFYLALAGMAMWGVGMGAQESIMRAAVASMAPRERLGFAFGTLNAAYGLLWFMGSLLMGILYDFSIGWLVAFSIAAQLVSVPVLLIVNRGLRDASRP